MDPFITALRLAFAAGVVFSILGAVISALRGGHRSWEDEAVVLDIEPAGEAEIADVGVEVEPAG